MEKKQRYKKYIKMIHNAKTDEEIAEIIDTVYEEGFDDGKQDDPLDPEPTPMFDPYELD